MICKDLSRIQSNKLYREVLGDKDAKSERLLCREDLFYLLSIACKRPDINNDWLYDRCREVEASPNGHLDLWAREHYKSTIITYGKSIQDILGSHGEDPLPIWKGMEITIGIFSHTRPIAKAFLEQIKTELEINEYLKSLFPDVLYDQPTSQAPKWALDSGIIVKRKTNPKEATVEAWGLVDAQPTSKHFYLMVYDDVVTMESVNTPEQIKKVTARWEMSSNLSAKGGVKRTIGTRYHVYDTYQVMMDRGVVRPRIHTATESGKWPGKSVLYTDAELMEKRKEQGPYTFGTQMLQDPIADKAMGFKKEWLKFYKKLPDTKGWNIYLTIDPAGEKKKTNDFTVMEVTGLAPDQNYYLLDGVRDRLNLTERTNKVFELHRKWNPKAVGYEKYGKDSDIEHIQYVMEEENYRFNIIALGGKLAKEDRIRKLVPPYEQFRYYMPEQLTYIDYEGIARDYVKQFIEDEFTAFPVAIHDDMLDCRARIMDPKLNAKFPKKKPKPQPGNAFANTARGSGGWMG